MGIAKKIFFGLLSGNVSLYSMSLMLHEDFEIQLQELIFDFNVLSFFNGKQTIDSNHIVQLWDGWLEVQDMKQKTLL